MISEKNRSNINDGGKEEKDLAYYRFCVTHLVVLLTQPVLVLFPLARWFPSRTSKSAGPEQTSTHKEDFNICQFLLDYRKQKELAEGIGIEEDDTEGIGNAVG